MKQRLFLMVSKAKSLCLVGAVLLSIQLGFAAGNEIVVTNNSELTAAINSAKPGDVIVMKDGEWKDVNLEFGSTATEDAPVTLKAQSAGKVILNGSSVLTFTKPNLKVDGLVFKGGAITKGAVINFNSDKCTVSNCAIIDYNPASFDTRYYWIFFSGNYNVLTHCFFKGKNNIEPVLGNAIDNSRHNMVTFCYFKDIPWAKQNGREIMRIWGPGKLGKPSADGAFFTVEHNLFDHADGEGVEIVSLKSNHNVVRFNTVRASMGGFTNRQGHNNTFEGNFFFGENRAGTLGIRVAGENLHVFNNYISNVSDNGLLLMAGEYMDKALTDGFKPGHGNKETLGAPRYCQVRNSLFENNTIINSGGKGLQLGDAYRKHWPEMQMCLLPEGNTIKNNLIMNCKESNIDVIPADPDPATSFLQFIPNKFEGNVVSGGELKGVDNVSGIIKKDEKGSFDKNGIYILKDATDSKTVGATEYMTNSAECHPLQPNEVGPSWMVGK